MQKKTLLSSLVLVGFLASGCGISVTTYVKPEAPWGLIKRVAVLPFAIPSENPVDRTLTTQLFTEELRKGGHVEVVDVPLESPVGSGAWDFKRIGKEYGADAVISGSVDDMRGSVIHMQVQDVATQDLLWSGTYLLGARAEFFSFKTQQQKLQRGFRRLVQRFTDESKAGASPSPIQ